MSMGYIGASVVAGAVATRNAKKAREAAAANQPAPVDLNRTFSTNNSTLQGGNLTLNPELLNLQNQIMQNSQNLNQNLSGNLSGFGDRFNNLSPVFQQNLNSYNSLGGNYDALNQNVMGLNNNLNNISGNLSNISGTIGNYQNTLGNQSQSLDPLKNVFGGLSNQVGSFNNKLGGIGEGYGQLSNEFAGNQGSLINARMNPLKAALAQRGGALERELGRTGVRGTFANQAKTNFSNEAARQIGDAQATATNDALNARAGMLNAQQNVLGQQGNMSGQQAQLANLIAGITNQQSGITGMQSNLAGMQSGIEGQQAALTGQQANNYNQVGANIAQQAGLVDRQGATAINMSDLIGKEISAEQANVNNQVLMQQLLQGTSAQAFQQELASLGLSVDSISQLLGAQNTQARTNAALDANYADQRTAINAAMMGTIGSAINKPKETKATGTV